jgi:hypothetical protein
MRAKPDETLVQAFRALPKRDRRRLMWHVEHGTDICCGQNTYMYSDGRGGG